MPDYDVTVYFENSNLYPENEFQKRREAAMTMADRFRLPFLTSAYRPCDWFSAVRGLALEPERGKRCETCIAFRLDETMRYAKENGFGWVATTLSVSRRKDVDQINRLGHELAAKHETGFLGQDWKKGNGEVISQQRAKEAGIYRQNYCGCVYSLVSGSRPAHPYPPNDRSI